MSTEQQEEKILTNSRWQDGNNVPRYDRYQQKELDGVLDGTPGFFRGARITGSKR